MPLAIFAGTMLGLLRIFSEFNSATGGVLGNNPGSGGVQHDSLQPAFEV